MHVDERISRATFYMRYSHSDQVWNIWSERLQFVHSNIRFKLKTFYYSCERSQFLHLFVFLFRSFCCAFPLYLPLCVSFFYFSFFYLVRSIAQHIQRLSSIYVCVPCNCTVWSMLKWKTCCILYLNETNFSYCCFILKILYLLAGCMQYSVYNHSFDFVVSNEFSLN